MSSIKNARLLRHEIPGLRARIKAKITTVVQEADRYGVGIETIRRAVRGETFRDVKEGLEAPPPEPNVPYGRRAGDVVREENADESLLELQRRLAQNGGTQEDKDNALEVFLRSRPTKKDVTQ